MVCDASFISLRLVLPAALALTRAGAWLVALIKPQFEVGKGQVGKGGVVRDPALHSAGLRRHRALARRGAGLAGAGNRGEPDHRAQGQSRVPDRRAAVLSPCAAARLSKYKTMGTEASILRARAGRTTRTRRDEVALRAFFRLVELWGLTMEEARVLLGRPSRATLYNWKAGRARGLPHDTLQRISYLLGIHKALQILYSEPALADAWVRRAERRVRRPERARAHAGGRRRRSRRGPRPSGCRARRRT